MFSQHGRSFLCRKEVCFHIILRFIIVCLSVRRGHPLLLLQISKFEIRTYHLFHHNVLHHLHFTQCNVNVVIIEFKITRYDVKT